MKSSPFTSFSTPAKLLPTALSMTSVPMLVIVAGASVIFSGRRDAETTTPASDSGARANVTSTRVSSPGRTTTPVTDCMRSPMRCTRTSYVPASTPLTVNRPPTSVIVPRRVPTTATCAPASGTFAESVTVPLMRPPCATTAPGTAATSTTHLTNRHPLLMQPETLIRPLLSIERASVRLCSPRFRLLAEPASYPQSLSVHPHDGLSLHHGLAVLIPARRCQPHPPLRRDDLDHFHARRHRVADAHGPREPQRLAQVD